MARLKELVASSRPPTGVFAFILTVISFRCLEETPWLLAMLTALAFTGATSSIMSYNDLVDRFHDRKKGNSFAYYNATALRRYLFSLNLTTALLLLGVGCWSPWAALFTGMVWGLGLWYSHVHRHLLWGNNFIVALCSGSPALVGVVHAGKFEFRSCLLFVTFLSLILLREVYKDVEDREADHGYKRTLPVVWGQVPTCLYLIVMTHLPVCALVLYPSYWVKAVAVICAFLQPYHLFMARQPQNVVQAKKIMDLVIPAILTNVLLTQ